MTHVTLDEAPMNAWASHLNACDHCKWKTFAGRVGGGNCNTIARMLCEAGKPLYEAFVREIDKASQPTENAP